MPEVATIEVEKIFTRTLPSGDKVFDLRTKDGQKYSAWDAMGEQFTAGKTYAVEYATKENNGFINKTVKKILSESGSGDPAPRSEATTPQDDRSKQINRSVAFKGAIDLYTAGNNVTGTLEDVILVDELTNALLAVVEGTVGKVIDGFGLEGTE
jgi:hypothetical protein